MTNPSNIPAEAVEAGRYYPPLVQVVRIGCQDCSYNNKYGMIRCKEHRGW